MEFRHHNVEFGYTYASEAVIDDGSAPYPTFPWIGSGSTNRARSPVIRFLTPGSNGGALRVALNTLVHGGKFVLIAGEDGQPWIDAARTQRHSRRSLLST